MMHRVLVIVRWLCSRRVRRTHWVWCQTAVLLRERRDLLDSTSLRRIESALEGARLSMARRANSQGLAESANRLKDVYRWILMPCPRRLLRNAVDCTR
ncbi:MAG: hypothetical protein M2R45_05319 [Verrucomicrobia subdivision 3 bacterium]|nr:hypothetical protein [Limisphaerales bacterium]MCS1415715.1 hypothetical protein [Limisphaerales bacterium]